MLMRFGFCGKMYYICIAKRTEPAPAGSCPPFMRKNMTFSGFPTSEIEKLLSEIEFILGVSGNFLGEVMASVADIGRWKVKIYLFYWDAFLTFQVTTQVDF